MTPATDPDDSTVEVSPILLARRHPDMSPEEQTAVRHLVGMWVKGD